ncbi:MAG: hypothetical protein KOO66_09990 [Bacteroidales bacterium]|nr:hypothetical protein [Bacteroidales bacterium]
MKNEKIVKLCANCEAKLNFRTTPNFGGGKLHDGGRVCRDCFQKLAKIDTGFGLNSKKIYDTARVKEVLANPDYFAKKQIQAKERKSTIQTSSSTNEKNVTVESLVKSVKNEKDLKKLERQSEKYMDKFQESDNDNTRYEKLSEIYQDAFDKACDIIFYYQFTPELELNTPRSILDFAYEVVNAEDYEKIRKEIGGTDYEWTEITGDCVYDDKLENALEKRPFYYDSMVKFRQIVDRDSSFETKQEEINSLANSDKSFFDEFFDRESNESAGEQWTKELLYSYGVPLIDRLYDLGYNTPQKIVEIDLEKIKSVNGLGPQKVEQLGIAIAKIKKNIL